MNRRLVLALVLPLVAAAGLLATAAPAQACSCAARSFRAAVNDAHGVFTGVTQELVEGRQVTRYVTVDSVYTGDPAPLITLNYGQEGPDGSANSCNLDLAPDRRLVFLASGADDEWGVGSCSYPYPQTAETLRKVERVLGPPQPPRGPISAPGPIVYGGPGTVAPELAVTAAVREALALLLAPVLGPADA